MSEQVPEPAPSDGQRFQLVITGEAEVIPGEPNTQED